MFLQNGPFRLPRPFAMLPLRFDIVLAFALAAFLATIGMRMTQYPIPYLFLQGVQTARPPFPEVILNVGNSIRIAVSRSEVTVGLWKECSAAGQCRPLASDQRDTPAQYPVTSINWLETCTFIEWLNRRTGLTYRLPDIGEWRLMNATMPHKPKVLRFTDPRLAWAAEYGVQEIYRKKPYPPGHFGRSSIGIEDLAGNVWEWTATCSTKGLDDASCPAYVVGGDHEANIPVFVTDPATGGCSAGTPPTNLGFRLVRTM